MAQDEELSRVWGHVVTTLEESPDITQRQLAFVRLAQPLGLLDGTIILAVGNEYTKEYLETKVRSEVTEALGSALGRDGRFAITVDPALVDDAPPAVRAMTSAPEQLADAPLERASSDGADEPAGVARPSSVRDDDLVDGGRDRTRDQQRGRDLDDEPARPTRSGSDSGARRQQAEPARLNPHYLFETFVIGSSNRFAHAAAVAVAEAPAKAYNPLFIYGDSGLGKTHLLHAIGHYAQNLYPSVRVRYVNSEEFTNDFINSISEGKAGAFQRRYREVDVLLIDDIQFLQGKEQTMEEFFHTFNTLHNANKQVVITSDLPPKQLNGFEDRMRSRFEWGLITDVQPPDLETRIAILRKKAGGDNMQAPPEVLEYIASKISTNIRELEGALIRVTAFASLNRQQVDLSLAEIVLKDLITDDQTTEITSTQVIGQTAAYFGLSIEDLCGSSRSRVLVTARQIAMYLCRELTDLSLPKIGQAFGGRDHTTVMHANRKIRELMAERRSIYNQVTELTNRIKQQSRG
ncbi:chromosomal replication initiator protein DnaA [Cellulomonas sp. DKR-3]|uniref:Chromosomal replication initiator protein DnaA n=1 Tax=Cellulomonas fulva TaxID=2835530 RepID=A0ABS5TWK0_9CELL|nr:chromosomal replication initiator protein DnaA [Cellulomonas fulva]MBT0993489.1 chromosomal replication initiator protein DnaA [Cellulomonas fulva]